jgi:hypothetical protein
MTEIAELSNITRAAEQLLTPLLHASGDELLRVLRPQADDYARVFVGGAAEVARTGFEQLWTAAPKPLAKPDQTIVKAFATDAANLRGDNDASRQFPGGYRAIAHHLQPGLTWVVFRVLVPGETQGISYDGLVRLGDRWAWFPKPWRILPAADEGN